MPFILEEGSTFHGRTNNGLEDDKEFWLIWCRETDPLQPTYRHLTERSAVLEAERLAANRPGHRFYIAHVTSYRAVREMQRVTLEPTDIPF
jgi:hypothetical protein